MGIPVIQQTRELVVRARQGDTTALSELCRLYGERVRRVVRLRMGAELRSRLDSMDVVQDTLIAAIRDLDAFTYHHEGDFLRWLAAVAENRIRDHVDHAHAAKRDVRREVRLPNWRGRDESRFDGAHTPVATTTPSMVLVRREEFDRLERAMDRLKPEHRQVLMLAKVDGLSHRQIALRLDRSQAAVAKLLSRAIVALANEFETDP